MLRFPYIYDGSMKYTLLLMTRYCFSVQSALDYGVRHQQNPSINVGSTVKLSVDLSKISSSVITWSLHGQPLVDSQRIDIDIVNGVASLMVKDAELSDSGVYTVEADNVELGSAFADFDLSVNAQGEHVFFATVNS